MLKAEKLEDMKEREQVMEGRETPRRRLRERAQDTQRERENAHI